MEKGTKNRDFPLLIFPNFGPYLTRGMYLEIACDKETAAEDSRQVQEKEGKEKREEVVDRCVSTEEDKIEWFIRQGESDDPQHGSLLPDTLT